MSGAESGLTVLAVQNYGRSGTLLVQSLLDSHPGVLSLPGLLMYDFYAFWPDVRPGATSAEATEIFISSHRTWFEPNPQLDFWGLHQMGEKMDETVLVGEGPFREALLALLPRTGPVRRSDFFVAVYRAYAAAIGRNVPSARLLIYPCHGRTLEEMRELSADFPGLRFLYMVREPLQNLGSTIARFMTLTDSRYNPVERAFRQMLLDYRLGEMPGESYTLYSYRPYFSELVGACRAMRLEDLHKEPEKAMRGLCAWLGLDWDPCLLNSTFNGKKWWNMPGSARISGTGTAVISQKHESLLSGFDRYRLTLLLRPRLLDWGYQAGAFSPAALCALPVLLFVPFRAELRAIRGFPARMRTLVLALPSIVTRLAYMAATRLNLPLPPRADLSSAVATFRTRFGSVIFSGPARVIFALPALPVALLLLLKDYFALRLICLRCLLKELLAPEAGVPLLKL